MSTLRLPKPYSSDELDRLAAAVAERPELSAACSFLLETGLRVSEFLSIPAELARTWPRPHRWCRRCRKHRAVLRVIGKGDKERLVPLTPTALRAAQVMLPHSNGHLSPWSARGLNYLLHRAGEPVGVHAHAHRFRHSYATRLVEAGAPIEVVADLMGHSSVNVTRLYYQLSEERAFAAVGRVSR